MRACARARACTRVRFINSERARTFFITPSFFTAIRMSDAVEQDLDAIIRQSIGMEDSTGFGVTPLSDYLPNDMEAADAGPADVETVPVSEPSESNALVAFPSADRALSLLQGKRMDELYAAVDLKFTNTINTLFDVMNKCGARVSDNLAKRVDAIGQSNAMRNDEHRRALEARIAELQQKTCAKLNALGSSDLTMSDDAMYVLCVLETHFPIVACICETDPENRGMMRLVRRSWQQTVADMKAVIEKGDDDKLQMYHKRKVVVSTSSLLCAYQLLTPDIQRASPVTATSFRGRLQKIGFQAINTKDSRSMGKYHFVRDQHFVTRATGKKSKKNASGENQPLRYMTLNQIRELNHSDTSHSYYEIPVGVLYYKMNNLGAQTTTRGIARDFLFTDKSIAAIKACEAARACPDAALFSDAMPVAAKNKRSRRKEPEPEPAPMDEEEEEDAEEEEEELPRPKRARRALVTAPPVVAAEHEEQEQEQEEKEDESEDEDKNNEDDEEREIAPRVSNATRATPGPKDSDIVRFKLVDEFYAVFSWAYNTETGKVSSVGKLLGHSDEPEKLKKLHVYVNITAYNDLLRNTCATRTTTVKCEKFVDECTLMTINGLNEVARSKPVPPCIMAKHFFTFSARNGVEMRPAAQKDCFAVCNACVFVRWLTSQREKYGGGDDDSNMGDESLDEMNTAIVSMKIKVADAISVQKASIGSVASSMAPAVAIKNTRCLKSTMREALLNKPR